MKALFQKFGACLAFLGALFFMAWPILLVVFIVSLAFTDTKLFLFSAAYVAGIAALVWGGSVLLTNKGYSE